MSDINIGIYTYPIKYSLGKYRTLVSIGRNNNCLTDCKYQYCLIDFGKFSMDNILNVNIESITQANKVSYLDISLDDFVAMCKSSASTEDIFEHFGIVDKIATADNCYIALDRFNPYQYNVLKYSLLLHLLREDSEGLSFILNLNNLYITQYQLQTDEYLNKILDILNSKNIGYVVYTNNTVYSYIKNSYKNIKLIASKYKYTVDTLDSFINSLGDSIFEVDMSMYSLVRPYIENKGINPENIWISFTPCKMNSCIGRNRCDRYKALYFNHKHPIIDATNTGYKYSEKYEPCYLEGVSDLSPLQDIIKRINDLKERGISNYLIEDRFFSKNSVLFDDLSELFLDNVKLVNQELV